MYHALDNHEINRLLSAHSATKNIYNGFLYPRDEKLPKISPPALYVVNTDYLNGPGLHWVLILFLRDKTIFVDPFGLSPDVHDFPLAVERVNNPVTYNIFTVQNFTTRSYSCGHFVILYAILLSQGFTLKNIETFFTKDTELNDNIATDVVTWLFDSMNLMTKIST